MPQAQQEAILVAAMGGPTISPIVALVYAGVLVLGLIVAALALVSLRRVVIRPGRGDGTAFTQLVALSLGVGAAVFGAAGLVSGYGFGRNMEQGILWALAAGIIATFATQIIFYRVAGRRLADLTAATPDVTGRVAEVTIAIPAAGLGEISVRAGDQQVKLGARAGTGHDIPAGTRVIVDRVTNRVAFVRPAEDAAIRAD